MATRPAKGARARISLACTSCREQKIRCDGGKPRCGCCQRKDPALQTACVYYSQAKVRESREIQKLLHQINHLQGRLAVVEPRNGSPGMGDGGDSGSRGLSGASEPDIQSQPSHETNTADGPVSNESPTPHVAESGEIISQGVEESAHHPGLSDSNLTQRQTESERSHEGDSAGIQHFNNTTGDQYAPANNEPPTILPDLGDGSATTEARNLESGMQFDRESFLRGHGMDATYDDPQGAGSSPQGDNGPYFAVRSSNTALMQEVNDIISPVTCTDQNTTPASSKGEPSIYSSHNNNDKAEGITHKLPSNYLSFRDHITFFELPPRSLADHLLDSYFNRVHLFYPFLHRPTFEAAYDKLWASADQRSSNGYGGGLVRFADAGLGNSINSGPQTRIFYAGVNAIFALSCQFSDLPIPKAREAAKVYLERATALLLDVELLDDPTISLVQLLLLLCLHLQGTPLRNRLWGMMGMACRMAQGLGLQLESSEDGKIKSPLEIEVRRRTWCSCVMMDLTISTTLGRPAMNPSEFTTPLPQAIDDENLCSSTLSSSPDVPRPQVGISLTSFFVEAIKLWELSEKITKALYPDTATRRKINTIGPMSGKEYSAAGFDVLVDLENMWTRLYLNLPQELRWSKVEANSAKSIENSMATPDTTPKWLKSQRGVLHTRVVLSADHPSKISFLYVKLLIYRPLFLRVYREKIPQQMKRAETQLSQAASSIHGDSEFEQPPTSIQYHFSTRFAIECFQTAEELLTLVHKFHRTKGAIAWWYNIFYAYFTGVITILTRFCPPLAEVVGISRIDESWVLCQEVLNHMLIYGNHAKRCLASLQALRSRLAAWESGSATNLQNLPAVYDYANNYPSTSNGYDQNAGPILMHESVQFGGREGRNDVPYFLGNLEAADDWAGALPWDSGFDSWWTHELVGEDFGSIPAFEPTYQ